jgi:hypothetical protein
MIVKPETLIGWHRKGFRLWWRWKSSLGRPRIPEDLRRLMVRMVGENPTWGEERVAGRVSRFASVAVRPARRNKPGSIATRSCYAGARLPAEGDTA